MVADEFAGICPAHGLTLALGRSLPTRYTDEKATDRETKCAT
jgi:hypothetical protein